MMGLERIRKINVTTDLTKKFVSPHDTKQINTILDMRCEYVRKRERNNFI